MHTVWMGTPGDFLFYLDVNGRLAYVSDNWCIDTGYTREELISKSLDALGIAADRLTFLSLFRQYMNSKRGNQEVVVTRKNGSRFTADIGLSEVLIGHRVMLRCELHQKGRLNHPSAIGPQ